MSGTPDDYTSPEAREIARVKAREIREKHRKRERRARFLIVGGIVAAVVVIVAVVATSIIGSQHPVTAGPLNMLNDGIRISTDLKAVPTTAREPDAGSTAVPAPTQSSAPAVSIVVYTDYLCPECGEFNRTNADQLKAWAQTGAATFEVHPLSLLNGKSQGTQYPQRAANAAACVANYAPDDFFVFHTSLFANQPDEGTAGLTDDQLVSYAKAAGVTDIGPVTDCITSLHFARWVKDATDRATVGPLQNADVPNVTTTPLVLVNGVSYTGPLTDAPSFAAFVVQAAGTAFSSTATATPTPTATQAPAPKPTSTK